MAAALLASAAMLLCLASSASALSFGLDTGNNALQLEQVQRAGATLYRFPLDMSMGVHAVAQSNGTLDVFYRTSSGTIGHHWFGSSGGGWSQGTLPGSL